MKSDDATSDREVRAQTAGIAMRSDLRTPTPSQRAQKGMSSCVKTGELAVVDVVSWLVPCVVVDVAPSPRGFHVLSVK